MDCIKREIEVTFTPTSKELAGIFCNLDADEQASFFNHIASIVDRTWERSFCFQLQAIVDSSALLPDGRAIMVQIGDYGEAIK